MTRANAVRALALAAAVTLWLPLLGLVDLVAPWFLDEETVVQDLGYGAITGLLVPAALLAHVRRPGTAVAALQQLALCAAAYALAGAIADAGYLLLGAGLGLVLLALLVLHPVGGMFFALPDEVSPYSPARPCSRPSVDFHVGLGSWGGLTAMGFGIALTAGLAAARTTGWRVPTWCAAAAAAVWGGGSFLPGHGASQCRRGGSGGSGPW